MGIKLFYQQSTAGSESWEDVSMTPGQNPDEWQGMIPSYALGSAYMRYYVVASDTAGNVTVEPEGADTDTLKASTFNVATLNVLALRVSVSAPSGSTVTFPAVSDATT